MWSTIRVSIAMFSVQAEMVLIQHKTNYFGFYLHLNPFFTIANEYFVAKYNTIYVCVLFLPLSPVVFQFRQKNFEHKLLFNHCKPQPNMHIKHIFFPRPLCRNVLFIRTKEKEKTLKKSMQNISIVRFFLVCCLYLVVNAVK